MDFGGRHSGSIFEWVWSESQVTVDLVQLEVLKASTLSHPGNNEILDYFYDFCSLPEKERGENKWSF